MQSVLPIRSARVVCAPSRPASVQRLTRSSRVARCTATAEHNDFQASMVKATALTSAVSTLLAAGNVSAAQELADIASVDGRFSVLATLSVPFFAWVGFNIFGPSIHQLSALQKKASFRSLAGLSLGLATVLAAQHVNAIELPDVSGAAEAITSTKRDGRFGILLTLLIPVAGWVLFNITGPALAQLDNMNRKAQGRRGLAGAVGLTAASVLLAQQADAATTSPARDGRFGILAVLLVPVGGWVLFNILGPALAQLDNMNKRNKGGGRRGIAGAVGLTAASVLMAQQADAATSPARDGRFGILAVLLIPVGGWVLFNILGPALSQLDSMNNKLKKTR